jgi:hypothetical protein
VGVSAPSGCVYYKINCFVDDMIRGKEFFPLLLVFLWEVASL